MDENEGLDSGDQSVEDKLAAAFERAEKPATPEALDEVADQAGVESEDASPSSEDAEPESAPEEDFEEVEYEAKVYKLPKELKDALLRQSDYTRKTQEVAESRRMVEAQRTQIELQTKFNAAHFEKAAELQSFHNQLQQFSQINWEALSQENPQQFMLLDRKQRTLQDQANRAQAELQQLVGRFTDEAKSAKQKAQQQCAEELKRTVPGFGPELVKGLDETGRSFGFTGEELAEVVDPRLIRVLHAAMQYQKLQNAKALVDKKVQSVKPVTPASARTAQSTQANAQLQELKAKAMKGRPSDVQSFLEKRFAKAMR